MKKVNLYILSFACLLLLPIEIHAQESQSEILTNAVSKYDLKTIEVKASKNFWVELGLKNNFSFNKTSQFLAIGYRKEFLGFDLRYTRGTTTHGEISKLALKNYNDPNTDNPEMDLVRNSNDEWTYWSLEPGFSVANQFFGGILSSFTERVRAGFAFGSYNDDQYNIPFKSYIFNAEATIIYPLKMLPNWTVNASINWNTGMIVRKYENEGLEEYGLPVSWLGSSLALEYYF